MKSSGRKEDNPEQEDKEHRDKERSKRQERIAKVEKALTKGPDSCV